MNKKYLQGSNIAGGNPARGRVSQNYYATHPDSVKSLLKVEKIISPILEPACGEGHISKFFDDGSYDIMSCDLINRGYGEGEINFLTHVFLHSYNTIITNPPFNLFQEFVERALKITSKKVIFFGKLQALEGQKRATFLQTTPLRSVYVFKKRQQPLRNGSKIDPLTGKKWASSTMAFAWFVWEKGYIKKPQIEWI